MRKMLVFTVVIASWALDAPISAAQTLSVANHLRNSDANLIGSVRALYGCSDRSCAKVPELRLSSPISSALAEAIRAAEAALKARSSDNSEPDTCEYDFALWGSQDDELRRIEVMSILNGPSRAEVVVGLAGKGRAKMKKTLHFVKVQNRWLLEDIVGDYSLRLRLLMDVDARCSYSAQQR